MVIVVGLQPYTLMFCFCWTQRQTRRVNSHSRSFSSQILSFLSGASSNSWVATDGDGKNSWAASHGASISSVKKLTDSLALPHSDVPLVTKVVFKPTATKRGFHGNITGSHDIPKKQLLECIVFIYLYKVGPPR